MGYTLKIGELVANEIDLDDGFYHVRLTADHQEGGPTDSSPTSGTNSRWPSYTGWAGFCRKTGVYELFFAEYEGLLAQHPGVAELRPEHLRAMQGAFLNLKQTKPAVYEEQEERIKWLLYWTEWALTNCRRPVFANS